MYDYIKVTDSKEKTEIIFAYAEPKENIRKEMFVFEKDTDAYKMFKETASGTEKGEYMLESEFFQALGTAIGQISCGVHKK